MTSNFRPATGVLLALALLAPLPSFAIGRDLTPVRMATPDYLRKSSGLCVTEKGFLLRWSSDTHDYGTTTDGEGVPRLPASSMPPSTGKLFPNGNGCLALSQNGITDLDADGAVRRTAVLDIAALPFTNSAFNGTNVFLGKFFVSEFTGFIVDQNGHVLTTTRLPIDGSSASAVDVTASADGGFSIIVADYFYGLYAMQISAGGQVTGKVDLFTPGNRSSYLVTAATNAGQTVVAWTNVGSTFVHTVALRDGVVVRDTVLPNGVERSQKITLLPSGNGFILLRNGTVGTARRLLGLRLDANGEPLNATPSLILNGSYGDLAANARTLVVFGGRDEPNARAIEVTAAIGDSGIVPTAVYDVVATAVRQADPAVASDGVDFFGTWVESTSTNIAIMAGRVTRSGLPLDGTGFVVAESPSSPVTPPLVTPSVAFGGGVYLVVYATVDLPNHKVMGRRFARDGTPIDPAPFVIGSNGIDPTVAFGGGRFLVAWDIFVANKIDSVVGATVGTSGPADGEQLLTPAPALELPEETGVVGPPTIGWNGRHFIVACSMAGRVRMLRTSAFGTPLDAHTTAVPNEAGSPAIACSDQECLIGAGRGNDLVAAIVHDDAGLRADAPKIAVTGHPAPFAVAFDGASYILAWRTGDAVGLTHVSRGGEPYGSASAATVNTNGSAAASPPALAANSAGDTAIVTTEFSMVWLIDRARLYFASEFPLPRRRSSAP